MIKGRCKEEIISNFKSRFVNYKVISQNFIDFVNNFDIRSFFYKDRFFYIWSRRQILGGLEE